MALFKKKTSDFNFKIPPDNDPWKFVTDPNDPNYKSYSDSLSLYNNSKKSYDYFAQDVYNKRLEDYNKMMSRDWFTKEEKKAFRKPTISSYTTNVRPMNQSGSYDKQEIRKNNIQPIGFKTDVIGGEGFVDTWVYKKPTIPVFVKGTELANNAEKQIMLQKAGLYTGKIDGIWGNKSIAAMQEYERQQQNATPVQSTSQTVTSYQSANQIAAPVTQQPIVEAKPTVPKVVSGISKDYGAYTSTSGDRPNISESNSFGSSTNVKGYYYTVRYGDGTINVLTPAEYEQYKSSSEYIKYKSSNNKAFKKQT